MEISIASVEGNTLYVGGNGPGNYSSIQLAVNDSSDGGTVFVYNGTYFEDIDIYKSINVIGQDKNTTFVNSNDELEKGVFYIKADNVTIKGFTIQDGQAGIHILGDKEGCNENFQILDCNIINNFFDIGGLAVRV
jgi:hypothetical protein